MALRCMEVIELLYRDAGRQQFVALLDDIKALPDDDAKALLARSIEMGITIKERFELLQQRERGLLAVIETAQDLTAITDLDQVLRAIVQRARKLLGCDIGYLSIYDATQGDFYVRATDGAFSEKFKQIRVGLAVGICGFVARNKAPYSSSDYGTDGRFTHTQSIDTGVLDEGIKSILGVPLLAGEQVIGVLFVGDRYVRAYAAGEMSILSTLAAHASVAIGNARLFEQAQAALQQASQTNLLLARQTADTRNAAEAHEQLTSLVARGGDLKNLCEMVAGMLGGHVAVYDEGEQEVCSSISPAYQRPDDARQPSGPRYWFEDQVHAALGQSRTLGRSVIAFERPGQVCRVSAVTGGRGMLGALVICTAAPLGEVAIRVFERSSMVTGVVLLSQERRESAALAELPLFLRSLVSPNQRDVAHLPDQAARYGLDLSQSICVTAVESDRDRNSYIVKRLSAEFKAAGLVFAEMDGLLVFFGGVESADRLPQSLPPFFARHLRLPMTGVMSTPVHSASELPRAYQAVRRCLGFLRLLDRKGSIFLERELSLYSVLFEKQGREDIDSFLVSALGALYSGDDARHAELARTLLEYLDCGHNARSAAKALDIHINTLRQRLDAIDAMLGHWRNTARALEVHMALRLWRLSRGQKFFA
ncbi:GAF domain-containing protein [Paralcaligenes sp. KSB-10]|uniref:helix-turn-helix domain-containing protein n=1 Tax=Paralcaligenes sp. KSB-10 TaxID=2901142 RepID=UPI001E50E6B8|nr:GAF domain-containing protein [Paralcaligenes sp. KSB-10]UHL64992.1 GAF domain-containing protein [Paralcaligenes sp. KSB-10]